MGYPVQLTLDLVYLESSSPRVWEARAYFSTEFLRAYGDDISFPVPKSPPAGAERPKAVPPPDALSDSPV